jgi:hypothetical protein
MLQFIYAKELLTTEAGQEIERDAYFNAFEILQFYPMNEKDTSRGVYVDFKNGETKAYKCDLIDFMKAVEEARNMTLVKMLTAQINGNKDNDKQPKPKARTNTRKRA